MSRRFLPHEIVEPPRLDSTAPAPPLERRRALLIDPFYPKDPHASFGKHVLTPTLALTSVAAATPPHRARQRRSGDGRRLRCGRGSPLPLRPGYNSADDPAARRARDARADRGGARRPPR